jgi:transcriptional regulator with XRE-family HTH domain
MWELRATIRGRKGDYDLIISSEQIRAARALLRWEQRDLAEASKVSLPSIKRLETSPGPLAAQARTIEALRAALEAAGIEFTDGGQPGVKLRANYNPKTGLVGPDPFRGGDFQAVVTSRLRRPARSKKPPA